MDPNLTVYEGFYFKIDIDGNLIWLQYWDDPLIYSRKIQVISDTEYLLFNDYYEIGAPTSADLFQTRVAASTGNVIWTSDRLDLFSAIPYIDDVTGVVSVNSVHYATGRIIVTGSPVSGCRAYITKFDIGGNNLWT